MYVLSETPLVSVCVNTYNHVEYIEQTLHSIFAQKTDFKIEVLVHDDASTDGTTDILKRCEMEQPAFLKVFYENENQWGKGTYKGGYLRGILAPAARGKYIAFCEGDDFWLDPNKLQKQALYLESHPDCVFTCHAANVIDGASANPICSMGMGDYEHDLTSKEIIVNWNVPTASWVYRKEIFDSKEEDWPGLFPVGDFPTVLYASTAGNVHYFPDVMSAYRFQVPGSWTSGLNDESKRTNNARRWLRMYGEIDAFTGQRWHETFIQAGRPLLRSVLSFDKTIELTGFEGEVRAALRPKDWTVVWGKRALRCLGYSLEPVGFGKNGGRKIVRLISADE